GVGSLEKPVSGLFVPPSGSLLTMATSMASTRLSASRFVSIAAFQSIAPSGPDRSGQDRVGLEGGGQVFRCAGGSTARLRGVVRCSCRIRKVVLPDLWKMRGRCWGASGTREGDAGRTRGLFGGG